MSSAADSNAAPCVQMSDTSQGVAAAASDARAAQAEADMQAHAGDVGEWLGVDTGMQDNSQVMLWGRVGLQDLL